MVGRDGIEPPTPGFSVPDHDACKCAYLVDVETRGSRRPRALEYAGMRPS